MRHDDGVSPPPAVAPLMEARCAAHPGRLAVDRCPVCRRPRCGADQQLGEGCTVCLATAAGDLPTHRPPSARELLVRAALAGYAMALVWAAVTAEYVGAGLLSYFSAALLGVLCAGAAMSAAGSPRGGVLARQVRVTAVPLAVLGAGLGFLLEGTYGALSLNIDVLVPYAITAAAAWQWNAPPKGKKPKKPR
jgi:hypothetical protein